MSHSTYLVVRGQKNDLRCFRPLFFSPAPSSLQSALHSHPPHQQKYIRLDITRESIVRLPCVSPSSPVSSPPATTTPRHATHTTNLSTRNATSNTEYSTTSPAIEQLITTHNPCTVAMAPRLAPKDAEVKLSVPPKISCTTRGAGCRICPRPWHQGSVW